MAAAQCAGRRSRAVVPGRGRRRRCQFVLENAEIEFAIVEDQEQVDKLLEIRASYPTLKHIVYDDPRGLRHYPDPELMCFERLQERGPRVRRAHTGFYADRDRARVAPTTRR